ncbi:MAG: glycosyltransferase family 2 protein [Alphaproteobacteria bacterium]|nr:glycosyltransferase family 2 protein [Alphaproteobacteria bacterium]
MKKKPAISIVIPMYNVENYLRRCLDSLQNQTFSDWQAICVNDGSKDKTSEIAHEYAKKDKRFVVIDKENGGQSEARNIAVKQATGDFILFLDSDDFIHHQTLELTYNAAIKNSADMVMFNHDVKFHDALRKRLLQGEDISGVLPEKRNKIYSGARAKLVKNVIFHATEKKRTFRVKRPIRRHCYPVLALYRAELVKERPFIRGIIIEDFPWWVSILMARPKTVMLDLPLYFYMPNGASTLNSAKDLFMLQSLSVGLKASFDLYKQNATTAEFKHFNREFLWPFIIIMMQKVRGLTNKKNIDAAKKSVLDVYNHGVCDMPCNGRAKKYKRRIQEFIK